MMTNKAISLKAVKTICTLLAQEMLVTFIAVKNTENNNSLGLNKKAVPMPTNEAVAFLLH